MTTCFLYHYFSTPSSHERFMKLLCKGVPPTPSHDDTPPCCSPPLASQSISFYKAPTTTVILSGWLSFHATTTRWWDLQCPSDGPPPSTMWNAWHGNNDTIKLYCCPPARMLYQQTGCLSVYRSIYLVQEWQWSSSAAAAARDGDGAEERQHRTDYLYRIYIEGCPSHAFSPVSPLISSSITLCYGSHGRRTRWLLGCPCAISPGIVTHPQCHL